MRVSLRWLPIVYTPWPIAYILGLEQCPGSFKPQNPEPCFERWATLHKFFILLVVVWRLLFAFCTALARTELEQSEAGPAASGGPVHLCI